MPIVLGHMGHGHIVYINGAIEVAKRNDYVFLETSGMPMHNKIKETADVVGVDRVLYGSDTPFGHPAFERKKVEVSGLQRDELDKVLGENASRLFRIDWSLKEDPQLPEGFEHAPSFLRNIQVSAPTLAV